MKCNLPDTFIILAEALKKANHASLANTLLEKPSANHKASCFKQMDTDLVAQNVNVNQNDKPLEIKMTYAKKFCDIPLPGGIIKPYSTRSPNRGAVLIINNIEFDDEDRFETRNGAVVDEKNLKELFEKIGMTVTIIRNQTAQVSI